MPSSDVVPLPPSEEAFFQKFEQDPEFARWSQLLRRIPFVAIPLRLEFC